MATLTKLVQTNIDTEVFEEHKILYGAIWTLPPLRRAGEGGDDAHLTHGAQAEAPRDRFSRGALLFVVTHRTTVHEEESWPENEGIAGEFTNQVNDFQAP